MTQDVVVDTTKKFILGKREYAELAFVVEKAVTLIREEAVEKILKCVDRYLKQRFKQRSDSNQWTVKFVESGHLPQAVRIKKLSWQCGGGTDWPEWEGVRLDRNWNGANISVSPIENVAPAEIMKLFHKQNIGTPRTRKSSGIDYVYCGLEGDLKDWNGPDFVFRAWQTPEQIAKDLAEKMETLAQKIDDVLSKKIP